MTHTADFLPSGSPNVLETGKVGYSAPSNIALVKYWGKTSGQLPANPSISFTLQHCQTRTWVEFHKQTTGIVSFDLFFEGKSKDSFRPKIQTFLERILPYQPFLNDYHLTIHTENTFPHSSGIASSASGMAALSACLMALEQQLYPDMTETYFRTKASFLARLGSGSAGRSLYGNPVVWGQHADVPGSSDLFGVTLPFDLHPVFKNYQDTILLVDKGEKTVSSTAGHNLMHGHPYAERRFQQAHENLSELLKALQTGDLEKFIAITESEALTLHAMMMTSMPYFILMKPNTLAILDRIWSFRRETGIPVCFTLDAGANVHVLYPENVREVVLQLITGELVAYCEKGQYICDETGNGLKQLTIEN